jgi:hypothetical protein
LTLALAVAVMACTGGVASADSTVVNATVYDGAGGSAAPQSVLLSTLNGCTAYGGPGTSPLTLDPGGQAYQPTPTSWSLATVVACGLKIPLSSVTSVQVYNPSGGFETGLSSAQLSNPGQWADPAAPSALPLISHDGTQDQNTYVRPLSGPTDANVTDQVVDPGPIAIVVYEGNPPLSVTATSQQLSSTSFSFSSTVTGAGGAIVPSSALTYSWSFGDGGTSTAAAPAHTFAPGRYVVTLQVTDTANDLGGTDTISVQVGSGSPGSGGTPQTGGTKPTSGTAPNGPSKSAGKTPGGHPGKDNKPASSGRGHGGKPAATSNTGSGTQATSTTTGSATTPASTTTSAHQTAAARHAQHRTTATTAQAALVAGRLLSRVTPLPAAESPFVHTVQRSTATATAPAVRRAVAASTSPSAALGAGLGVLILFGLGAWRELGWRRSRRLPRLGR